MKNIYKYTLLVIMLVFAIVSCIDDKGNYNYEDGNDVMSVIIKDLPNNVVVFRNLTLAPTLENIKENTKYEYRWFCFRTNSIPYETTIELGTTKDIDVDISKLEPTNYELYFQIKDIDRNVFERKRMSMSIQLSDIQKGWYILKDIDGLTDFDYVSQEAVHYKDVLRDHTPTGKLQLVGKAKQIVFQRADYTHQIIENGKVVETLKNQRVFHIITDQAYSVINAVSLAQFKSIDNTFFEEPTIKQPHAVDYSLNLYFVNGGKPYAQTGSGADIGLFSYHPAESGGYEIANTPIIANFQGALMFDKKWRSFKKFAPTNNSFFTLNEPTDPSKPSPIKMDADILEIMPAKVLANGSDADIMGGTGVALMKNINKDEHYLIKLSLRDLYPFTLIDTLKNSNAPVLKSPIRAALREGNFVYYTNSQGNELWAYNYSSTTIQRDQLIKTFDAGEKITSIQDIYVSEDEKTTHIVIATSLAGQKWKTYRFALDSTGNPTLISEPIETYEGDGTVRYVLLRTE